MTAAATARRVPTVERGSTSPFPQPVQDAGPPGYRRPRVDLTRVITTTEVVVGAVLIARRIAARPAPAKAYVTMGPGGWVSLKGGSAAVRPASRPWGRPRPLVAGAPSRRPPWARVLAAVPLGSLLG